MVSRAPFSAQTTRRQPFKHSFILEKEKKEIPDHTVPERKLNLITIYQKSQSIPPTVSVSGLYSFLWLGELLCEVLSFLAYTLLGQ